MIKQIFKKGFKHILLISLLQVPYEYIYIYLKPLFGLFSIICLHVCLPKCYQMGLHLSFWPITIKLLQVLGFTAHACKTVLSNGNARMVFYRNRKCAIFLLFKQDLAFAVTTTSQRLLECYPRKTRDTCFRYFKAHIWETFTINYMYNCCFLIVPSTLIPFLENDVHALFCNFLTPSDKVLKCIIVYIYICNCFSNTLTT